MEGIIPGWCYQGPCTLSLPAPLLPDVHIYSLYIINTNTSRYLYLQVLVVLGVVGTMPGANHTITTPVSINTFIVYVFHSP